MRSVDPDADDRQGNGLTDRMTVPQVAAYLHCSEWKARRLLGGDIPAFFDGRRWTAARGDVIKYVDAKTQTGKHRRPKGQRGRGKSLGASRDRSQRSA